MRTAPRKTAKKTAHPPADSHRHPTPAKRTPVTTASVPAPDSAPEPVDANNAGIEREGGSSPARRSEERVTGTTSSER